MNERPQTGALSSSDVYRINSCAAKVGEVFHEARREARDECLWLAATCRMLLDQNDKLRIQVEGLKKQLAEAQYRTTGEPHA